MKYINYVRNTFGANNFPVFTVTDLKVALGAMGISKDYLRLLIHNLLHKGEIKRITKGVYTAHDDATVVGFAYGSFYYGLENALSIRGFSDQSTNFVVLTPRNVRQGIRNFDGRNYLVKRLDSSFFFGYDLIRYGNFWVPVSDLEKTVIDMVYFDDFISPESWEIIKPKLDVKKLTLYLKKYDSKFRKKVLEEVRNHNALVIPRVKTHAKP